MNTNILSRFACVLTVAGFVLAAPPGYANTPDGETPADETVCEGVAKGLQGLCNAYCEAMDCDSDFPSASGKACQQVYKNYVRRSEGNDPPCTCEGRCQAVYDRQIEICEDDRDNALSQCENSYGSCLSYCRGDQSCEERCDTELLECKNQSSSDFGNCTDKSLKELTECPQVCTSP